MLYNCTRTLFMEDICLKSRESKSIMQQCMLDFSELLLLFGAEVYRVEDSLRRIGAAYGIEKTDIFVITENIIITNLYQDGTLLSGSRRISSTASYDFDKIDKLNNLSREICEHPIEPKELLEKLKEIKELKQSPFFRYCGNFFVAFGFALYYGGTIFDATVSGIFGLFIALLQRKIQDYCPNGVSFSFLASFVCGVFICFVTKATNLSRAMIMIGDIMPLIPGTAITLALRDILVGDTVSGILKLIESVLIAGGIAGGFMIAIMLVGV